MPDLNGDQFSSVLPEGSRFIHVTSKAYVPSIKEEGFRPSRAGESGPGVYVTNSEKLAGKMTTNAPYRQRLKVETTQPLNVLDRTKPGAEEHYRNLTRGMKQEDIPAEMQKHGYHGVTGWDPKNHEVAVHDPAHLRVTDWGDHGA